MIVGSFFSGIGMLDYGLSLAGVEHAWFCEADPWRREILARRWPGRQDNWTSGDMWWAVEEPHGD